MIASVLCPRWDGLPLRTTDRMARCQDSQVPCLFPVHAAKRGRNPAATRLTRDGLRETGMVVDFQAARRAMVDGQVRTDGVTHLGVIAAMLDIPRERFVPEGGTALAYLDRDVLIA